MSLWDSARGFGAPVFISEVPSFHPLTLLVGDRRLIAILATVLSAVCLYSIFRVAGLNRGLAAICSLPALLLLVMPRAAFVVLGITSSLVAFHWFVQKSDRLRWLVFTAVLTTAFLSSPHGLMDVLLPLAVLLVIWAARSTEQWAAASAGALVSAALAIALSAVWWMPAQRVSIERAPERTETCGGAIREEKRAGEPWRVLDLTAPPEPAFQSQSLVWFRPLVCGQQGRWTLDSPAFRFLNTRLVNEKPVSLPRFFFAGRFAVERDSPQAVEQLRHLDEFRELATVDHVPAKTIRDSGGQLVQNAPLSGGSLRIREYDRGRSRLDVISNGWNLVVSSDPWWSGWRAYWNGERIPPVLVNGAFVGAFIPPGRGVLRLRYRPEEFDSGVRAATFGVIALVLTAVWPWFMLVPSPPLPRIAIDYWRPLAALRTSIVSRAAAVPWATIGRAAALMLFAGYAAVLITHRVDIAGGADSSGYLNQARLWSRGNPVVPIALLHELRLPTEHAGVLSPLGFTPGQQPGTMVPTYPPGVPLHMAVLRMIGGDRAMYFFGPLAAIAAILLMYAFGRQLGLSFAWSAAGASILAVCPLFVFNGIQPVSDVAATAWSLVPMIAAIRSRESWKWGLVAGAALGIAVLVRPTELLMAPAMALAARMRWRSLIAIGAGGVPFAIFQTVTADHLYGNPFRTGYGPVDWLFAWSNFPPRFLHYTHWTSVLLTPLVFPAGLGAVAVRGIDRYVRASLAVWFLAFLTFYCFYSPYQDWGATRFLLPAFPALIFLALLGARALLGRLRSTSRRITTLLLVIVVLGSGVQQTRRMGVLDAIEGQYAYREASLGIQSLLSPRPIIVGMELGGAYFYYVGDTFVNWTALDPDKFTLLRTHALLAGRKWYALLSHFEIAEAMRRAPGRWVPIARFRDVTLFELR